jgi:hypothetical protein
MNKQILVDALEVVKLAIESGDTEFLQELIFTLQSQAWDEQE